MAFEYIPGKTIFHRLDPRVKLFYWIAMIALVLLVDTDPIALGFVLISIILLVKLAKISLGRIASFFKAVSPLATLYALFNLLFPPLAAEFVEPYIFFYLIPPATLPISLEAIVYMVGALFRFLIILLVIRTTLMLTPLRDLVLALVKFGLPPEFGVAMSTGFAYVPVMIDENQKIKEALQSRGWKYEFRNPLKRFDALLRKMFIPSVFNSMRRTGDIAIAIESRGFGYDIRRRTYMRVLKFTRADYVACGVLVAIVVLGFIAGPWGFRWAYYKNVVDILKEWLLTGAK
ncbi:MAG: energy-coupling factor transporter transmembrane component T family protein [Candidatus Bathyarchaeia archaeon]